MVHDEGEVVFAEHFFSRVVEVCVYNISQNVGSVPYMVNLSFRWGILYRGTPVIPRIPINKINTP